MKTLSKRASRVEIAKQALSEGFASLQQFHQNGGSGSDLCSRLSSLRDGVLQQLFKDVVAEHGEVGGGEVHRASNVASGLAADISLVSHGGDGRRDVAPHSDVDLMILYRPAARSQVVPVAEQFVRDVFDASLALGHSIRTPDQAAQLAWQDPATATSLVESRLLAGSEELFSQFQRMFRRYMRRQPRKLISSIVSCRREETERYGETAYLLEPNIKRSRGTLRDLQLVRWIGAIRYGTPEPERLVDLGVLSEEDGQALQHAREFLLRLRAELHFHAGKPKDVLDRREQLRLAEWLGYGASAGLLPVERFMRDYFRHTGKVGYIADRFIARARSSGRVARVVTAVFGRQIDHDLQAGPAGIVATGRQSDDAGDRLTTIVRMADLANLHNKPIAPETWEAVRQTALQLPEYVSAVASRHFLSLLGQPSRLGTLLRDLHEATILERFIPVFAHARGLLQFNQYHKYTIDEHCLRSVEAATKLLLDKRELGHAYRSIEAKHILHLALLIHDLGKGFGQDHSEVGQRIATEAAQRLRITADEADSLVFLVGKHLLMTHLVFRRDTTDQRLITQFAQEVGTPERLRMLYVLSAADLTAVGPGVWDSWKEEILTDFYTRAMNCLTISDFPNELANVTASAEGPVAVEPTEHAKLLEQLTKREFAVDDRYLPEVNVIELTVATHEHVAPGVFHRLCGALTSRGLEIRSAHIETHDRDIVLDKFCVRDPDFAGAPSPQRMEEIHKVLERSLYASTGEKPSFRRTLGTVNNSSATLSEMTTRVRVDNDTSTEFTILEIHAKDHVGLLYAIARALFDLELSVARAKVGTDLDQVVDVFYVTDSKGRKVEDLPRVQAIRHRLLELIESGA